jgi:hypothetical protein
MNKTNFDQSASGVNLELVIFWDCDRAQADSSECFNIIQHSGYRTNSILEYLDFGNIDQSFDFEDLANYDFTKKELIGALKSGGYWDQSNARYKGYDLYKATKQELCDYLKEASYYDDLAKFLKENFKANYKTLVSRGYCQGDYAEIIYSKNAIAWLEKETAKTWDQLEKDLQIEADHLLWDAPLYARLTVNDADEIYLEELVKDLYFYDKNALLLEFKRVYSEKLENFDIIYQFLADELPKNPNYQY